MIMMATVHTISLYKEVNFINSITKKTAQSLSNFLEDTIEINDLIDLNLLLNSIKNENISTLIFTPAIEYNIYPKRLQIGENIYSAAYRIMNSFDIKNNGHAIGTFQIHLDLLQISKTVLKTNLPLYLIIFIFLILVFTISHFKIASTLVRISSDAKKLSDEELSLNEIEEYYAKLSSKSSRNSLSDIYISVLQNLFSSFRNNIEADQIKRTSNERMKIASQVSHDIRGPLAALQTSLGNQTNNDIVKLSLKRIENIANELLDDQRTNEYLEIFNPAAQIFDIILEKKAVHLDTTITCQDLSPNLHIRANISNFNRTISNLMNNSIEAMAENGKIEISFTESQGKLTIIISDNGKGMSPAIVETLNSGKSISSGKENGNGIGFQSSYCHIKSWGGDLKLSSTEEVGTTLEITLPLIVVDCDKDIIHIDDDELVRMTWLAYADSKNRPIHSYSSLSEVDLSMISKDSVFYVDHDLENDQLTGVEYCQSLIEQGYENIFLSTGHERSHFQDIHPKIEVMGKKPPF